MLRLITLGMIMGFAFAAPPGIVAAETFRRGLSRGFAAALGVQLGSLIGDCVYALLALAGLAVLAQDALVERGLGIIGAFFLIYLGVSGLWKEFAAASKTVSPATAESNRHSAFLTGMLLSLTNPWAVGFWLSLGGMLGASAMITSIFDGMFFFGAFISMCLLYALIVSLVVGWTRRALPPRIGHALAPACNGIVGALGLWLGWRVIQMFVS